MHEHKHLVEVCEASRERHGDKLAYRYLRDGGDAQALSFAALRDAAVGLAARLQQVGARGDRALIICPQGMDYVTALWGCIYSGLIAVPAYAPRNSHHAERLKTIVESAQARVVLLSSRQLRAVRSIDEKQGMLASLRWIVVDDPASDEATADAWVPPAIEPDDLALLQYTSGSVKAPRGVMVSHRNMLANQAMIRRAFGHGPDTTAVLWLPLFHDMGLVSLIQGVYSGYSSHLLSPLEFLTRPLRWLEAITELRGTTTAAPDFAYRLCVEKIRDEQLAQLDLSSLVTAIDGAEPVSPANLDAFARRFAACGFRRSAFFPSYGLAEATLLVTGRRPGGAPRITTQVLSEAGREVARIACGLPVDGCEVRVVDERGRTCPAGHVGEIWVRGEHVAAGYWNDPAATRETFGAVTGEGEGGFLRTGDLGYLDDDELVVSGRIKDLIIVRGANYYPNDIEATATASHPQLVAGGAAAFVDADERLCVVAELRKDATQPLALEAAIVAAVSETYGLQVERVVLVKERTLPRTSSGKIQRGETRRALAADELHVVHVSAGATELQRLLEAADENDGQEILGGFLLGLLAEQLGLPLHRLSRHKSVTALGLDSLALVQLKDRVEAELPIELPAELLFAETTIATLASEIFKRMSRDEERGEARSSAPSSGRFAATTSQTILWAIQQRERDATAYNEGLMARVEGPIDLAALRASLEVLTRRHPALRTTFEECDGQLWQRVAPASAVELQVESAASTEQALASGRAVLDAPFELEREAWRWRVIHGPEGSYLAFAVHHIVFDMWSFGVFLAELGAIYGACVADQPLPLPAVEQGAAWLERARTQEEHLASAAGQRDLGYWREALAGAPPTSRFPAANATRARGARRQRFVVSRASLAALQGFARAEELTLFQVLLGGFFLLLSKYTGQDDLVIGTPLLGRVHGDSLRDLGYFVNLAPVRVRGVENTDVRGLLRQTKRSLEGCQRHQAIPFARLVEALGGGASWVQTSFSLLSSQLAGRGELAPFVLGTAGGRLRLGAATLHSCAHERREAQFDLACTLMERDGELHGHVDVRADLYEADTVERLVANYVALLERMVQSADRETRSLSAVSDPERALLRKHLRRSARPSANASVVEWFRAAANRYGEQVALAGAGVTLTYAELERATDCVARALVERGLRRGEFVALAFADRTRQTIAAVAVLKAAGVFVPLDLGHPGERLRHCVRDSGATWILADEASAGRIAASGAAVLVLDQLSASGSSIALPTLASDDLAYCIYTSGSTGAPKGVVVPHRGLLNLVEWHVASFAVDASARASLLAGPAFDVAVWEVWPYLCTGGALLEPPEAIKAAAPELARWIREQRLTHSFVPTALVELMLEDLSLDLGALRYLLTAGDRLRVRPRPGQSFHCINAYGPTENSVITTAGRVEPDGDGLPDIGEPIAGQELYILDRHGNEAPLGVLGELHISGEGLAREYHRQPVRTAERFVPDPFVPGGRMYASGDVVRLDGAGRIHFVARNDDQVKIRGHRVELGELEAVLLRHPQISQCKVTLQSSAAIGPWIAAYVSAPSGNGPELEADLRTWLHERLPAYMVPGAFRWLDALPVDANGKIDRKQLPPIAEPSAERSAPTPFHGPLEQEVALLFAELIGAAEVGRDDDFFALGGHSLLAGRLVQRVRERLGLRISIADIFNNSRVHALAAFLLARGGTTEPAVLGPDLQRVPLSPAQRRLWFLQRLNPRSTDYNMTGVVRVRGELDLAALEGAFAKVVARHGALRTRFPEHEGEPYQEVLAHGTVSLECVHLDSREDEERDAAVERILRAWEAEPFALAEGPLLRTRFLALAPDEGLLFLSVHHIVADGRSLQILLAELAAFYRAARAGQEIGELAPVAQYVDHALASLGEEARARQSAARAYWQQHLTSLPPKLSVPSLPPGSDERDGGELRRPLPLALVDQVRTRAMAWKTTEFSIYLATLALLLGKTSGEPRLLLGIAYEGRDRAELQGAVGFFVNVLPILAEMATDEGFDALLARVRRHLTQAMAHSDASYEDIVQLARPRGDGAASELVQVMFDFEQFTPERLELDGVDAVVVARHDSTAKFDLTFRCRIGGDEPTIACNYRRKIYGSVVIEGLLAAYVALLRQVLVDPAVPLAALRLVDDATAAELLRRGVGPEHALPAGSLVERFEAGVRAHPERPALVSADGERLSYRALDASANRLARALREAGVKAGDVAAICLPPGPRFVLSALAILKLGAAYAPIDPRYPSERRQAIVADCRAPIVITEDGWSGLAARMPACSDAPLGVRTDAEAPVYVVYTSGTTGAPKGVVIPQRGLVNLCHWHARTYGLERGEAIRAAQTAGIGFDAAVWELWPYLLTGASVWFAPDAVRTDSRALARWLTETRVTHAFVATPLAHELLGDGWCGSSDLEFILTGGERLTSRALAGARYRLVNHYGPSENTVVATADAVALNGTRSPAIGRPIDNVAARVLGRDGQLLPPGIVGELYLGGASLFLGYRNDPEATRRLRIADPFAPGEWLYRTGDRVAWNDADELEFVGRADEQLKIRGFRIEPGEIVARLSAQPKVQSAVVRPVEHPATGLHLAAYVVARPGETIDVAELRDALVRSLPGFMVPTFILVLEGLPLTSNGKVDVERLPLPSWDAGPAVRPLATATERSLAAIWSQLLGAAVEDASANFFALGGHSLLAARAAAAIEAELGRECPLQTFFTAATLAELAAAIDAEAAYLPIPRMTPGERVPLSPLQRRLWLIQQFEPESVAYNVVGALELAGVIDLPALWRAVAELLARHGALRSRIEVIDGEPCQLVMDADEVFVARVWTWDDFRGMARAEQDARLADTIAGLARERFDLQRGPLLRLGGLALADDRVVLTVAVHHIVVDEWSMAVLQRDLLAFYHASRRGQAPELRELSVDYADYSAWATRRLHSREDALLAFWIEYLRDRPTPASLPRNARPGVECGAGQTRSLALGEALSTRVRARARDEGLSLLTILFAAHVAWLYQLTRTTDLIVGTPMHQRGRPELADVVGFFVNTLPIRIRFNRASSFRELLAQVRDNLAAVHRHHELSFERIAEHTVAGDEPLYRTMFDLRQRPTLAAERGDLVIKTLAQHVDAPMADLAVTLAEGEDGLVWSCTFRAELFDAEAIAAWGQGFRALLEAAVADMERPVHGLPFAPPQRPAVTPPRAAGRKRGAETLLAQFALQVAMQPSELALASAEERFSYLELDHATNQLAHHLASRGIRAGDPVGVEARHDASIILAILAVLKLGALYVPIDLELPDERLRGVLADAGCRHLLTVSVAELQGFTGAVASVRREHWQKFPRHAVGVPVHADDPVYLAYTSGTTGAPKSSVLSHRGVGNYIKTVRERFDVGPDDRFLLFAPLTFDASLEEIFLPLCSGASLYVGPRGVRDSVTALVELCERLEISVLVLPTAYWRLLAEHVEVVGSAALPTVRMISLGGETAPLATVARWVDTVGDRIALWNIYGPSECSIGCIVDPLAGAGVTVAGNYVPLRHPVTGVELHVLDDNLDPVPAGVDGEVYVGGPGLAHGYHRRPAATAEAFVPNPFGPPGSRLYRTGDRVRVDADGALQFLGRADFQVKIDGVRVEPGEVEALLEQHQAVARAVVLARNVGTPDNHLVAYVTLAEAGARVTAAQLLADLRTRLPSYMVPATLDIVAEFPLTTNQKIDRAALSERAPTPRAVIPAASDTEVLLLATWRELLPRAGFGVTDDFFSLGAGSLLVIQLITRIELHTGVRLTVRQIFEHPTVRALAQLVDARGHDAATAAAIPRIDATEVALSGAQQRIWYLQQVEAGSTAYHVPNCLRLAGPLRRAALLAAIAETIRDHESLRTVFVVRGDAPVQVVLPDIDATLIDHDFGDLEPGDAETRAAELARDLLEQPFELERGPLCRFHLIRLAPELHVLVSIFHHIIIDGWSVRVWNEQLARAYNRCVRGEGDEPRAPVRPLQYRDFSEWQRRLLDGGERERQLAYWRTALGGVLPSLELPTDFVRPSQPSGRGDVRMFRIDGELVVRLQALAQERQVSLFMVLLGAYFSLLFRYSRQSDLLVGIPALGRDRPELDGVIGFFVNTLVLRCRVDGAADFGELLRQVRDVYLDAAEHQDVPLEEIAAQVNAPHLDGRRAVFQTMFSFHEGEGTGAEALDGLDVRDFEFPHRSAKFDLYLATWTRDDGLVGAIEFRTDLFAGATIERMLGHFQRLLRDIVERPSAAVAHLQLLGEAEYDALVHRHNGPAMPLPPDGLAHRLIEQRAATNPERIAVTCGREALTYAQLNRRANLVARELLDRGARPEERVVLLLERDASYLVAMLACLKAGAAFVPMDPDYPRDKRAAMVRQASARFVLSAPRHAERIAEMGPELVAVELPQADVDDPRTRDLEVQVSGSSLAYVIYTSGSTGEPKGVMIEHRGMLNHLLNKVRGLALTADDVVAEMAATTFDVSIWQYLAALLVGGRTAVIEGDAAWLPRELLAELEREQVTVFESVPSHMHVILDELESRPDARPLPRLRTYISNAEALTPEQCRRWFRRLPHVTLINTYGATECSDDTSHLVIDAPSIGALPYMPIHGTLANLTTYVLDEWMQPTPMGVPGDIYIGGVGVGRGYIGDPQRTAQAFRPDPFAGEPDRRFYRTGDLGRFHPGGILEFLGRADFQVKIRGRRVELGEIEAALAAHDGLREVLVSAARSQQGNLYLLAYVVPASHPAPTAQELKSFVRARLVEHMVPAAFVFMDEFPLNDNGKVDRKRLPVLTDAELFHRHEYTPPATDTERELVALWARLLGVDALGVLDSFFELGGHSLLVAELMIAVRNRYGVELSFRQFFAGPSVRELAALIDRRDTLPASLMPALRRYLAQPRYELAPCQVPEWYAYQFDPASPVYNICVGDLFLRGKLDKPAFLRAWQQILQRHEVLHVRFGYRDGKPFQTVDQRIELRAEEVFWSREELVTDDEVLAEANRLTGALGVAPFEFERGPLFRLHLVSYGDDRHQLIFVVHHIIWDETSLINLTRELKEFYNAELERRAPEVPALQASYFDYVQWMHESLASGAFEASRQYWLAQYRTLPPLLDLPTDYPRPELQSYRGDAIETWLPRRVVRKVESFLKGNDATLFMLKLAVIDHYLHLLTGQRDFVIGCPIAGRARPEFAPLLGLFATPMPIRCEIDAGMTFRELLRHVAGRAVNAFEHFLYPSNQLIEELSHQKDLSRPKLFSVMFGVQNDKTDVLGGLSFRGLEASFEKVVDTENKSSRFDLNFVVDQFGSDIKFSCIYNTDLFHRETVALMLDNMTALLEAVIDDPDRPLHRYGDLRPDHADELGPRVPVAATTMHGGFEQQAARTPERTAVIAGDERCSYRELNQRANRLAHYLRSLGIAPGQTIAVALEPSIALLEALLAVLKAGCCYVPLVLDHPQKRLDAIVRDADVRAVLTTSTQQHRFVNTAAEPIAVDELADVLACFVADDLGPVDPRSLAYVLHTSGTTGQPRGIQLEHAGVADMLAAMQHQYALGAEDRVLFQTSITFDVSVQEIFWPLSVGAAVVVAPGHQLKGAREVAALIDRHAVTLAQFVPVTLEALVAARHKGTVSALPSLRQVLCGGAVLSRALLEAFRAAFSARLANHYGPTEVTVDASCFDCEQPFVGELAPIGRPLGNTRIFVLDDHGARVPRGVIGEIYVASPGLARGYLGDAAATEAAFVEREIDGVRHRLFRTGDLGKFDRDGLLYFRGRRDRQLKVRGNRVEADEIVGALMAHPDIAVAAIRWLGNSSDGERLVAYVEQDPSVNQVTTAAGPRYAFTLAQRPELLAAATAWQRRHQPAFFAGEATLRQLWPRLASDFPGLQFVVTDAADTIDLVGNAVPLWLPETDDALMTLGWREAFKKAFARERGPNTLYAFIGADTLADSAGWSVLLERHRELARAHGFTRIVYAHRPLGLRDVAPSDCAEWLLRAGEAEHSDPQLRAQRQHGGRLVGVVHESLQVEGTGCQWSEWTGAAVTRSGAVTVPTALRPVDVDLDANLWTYAEPCLLFFEKLAPANRRSPLDPASVRSFLLESLPAYMVPDAVHFLAEIPRTDSGKVDDKRLPAVDARGGIVRKAAETTLQRELAELVRQVLGTAVEVGLGDDFFVLGGQSLRAVELISEINHRYGADVKLREFYREPTIEHLERILNLHAKG
ncbi:amino acid adenylation domain-containing protein [Nannocystis sp. RBIL2]|uniref:non-ribosomal peptide synthetase n=1 Tax=Nannocystis sp. RBIL2 TaxID=2996788 RepID=UPI00226F8D81|nr:non-ribosomal peptide synthetase [Nannocystis sp. RBIL2]MCY1072265.1 amino acid adenylation domain-containing protein [Nannocystis sp. RBIL2]